MSSLIDVTMCIIFRLADIQRWVSSEYICECILRCLPSTTENITTKVVCNLISNISDVFGSIVNNRNPTSTCTMETNVRRINDKRIKFYYFTKANKTSIKQLQTQEDWENTYQFNHISTSTFSVRKYCEHVNKWKG